MTAEIRIIQAALDVDDERDALIVRGIVDQECLKHIKLDWYQRVQGFSTVHINKIMAAYFANAALADLTIGMRGHRYKESAGAYHLFDKCYCIDGGQRLWASGLAIRERPDLKIRLGAKIYFDTTEEIENEMFCLAGTSSIRISASIMIRNKKKQSKAAELLAEVSADPKFALVNRIQWDQVRQRHELLAGFTMAKTIGALHSHQVAGLTNSKVYELLAALDMLVDKIGPEIFTTNIIRFFDTIDRCWTLRHLSHSPQESRPHLADAFLRCIARLFSKYGEFWDGKPRAEFYCPEKMIRKLRNFQLSKYTAAHKVPKDIMYEVLRKHLGLDPQFEDINEAAE